MRAEEFKKFIRPYVMQAINSLGEIEQVRAMHRAGEDMVRFVAGWTCGRCLSEVRISRAT